MFFELNNYTEYQKYKWQLTDYPHIKITDKKLIINTKTGRELKYTVNGYSKGVWIGKKFLTNLNKHITKID